MNDEEKKAIAHLEWLLDDGILASEDEPYIEKILNLIEKQQVEIKEQQEIIDSTEETISGLYNDLENANWKASQREKIIKKKDAKIEDKESNNRILGEVVLKQTEEIKTKDKVIDLMAEQLTTPVNTKKWVIDYYTNKAKENN